MKNAFTTELERFPHREWLAVFAEIQKGGSFLYVRVDLRRHLSDDELKDEFYAVKAAIEAVDVTRPTKLQDWSLSFFHAGKPVDDFWSRSFSVRD